MDEQDISNQALIEILEGRQMLSISLFPSAIEQYIPSQVVDIVKRIAPLKSLLGAYSGAASMSGSATTNSATLKILKQTAAGLVKGHLSVPDSNLRNLPFAGKIDSKGVLRALVKRQGVDGSIIGRFTRSGFSGKFNVDQLAGAMKGLLKLAKH